MNNAVHSDPNCLPKRKDPRSEEENPNFYTLVVKARSVSFSLSSRSSSSQFLISRAPLFPFSRKNCCFSAFGERAVWSQVSLPSSSIGKKRQFLVQAILNFWFSSQSFQMSQPFTFSSRTHSVRIRFLHFLKHDGHRPPHLVFLPSP